MTTHNDRIGHEVLERLTTDGSEHQVVLLTGGWGVGKTHLWKERISTVLPHGTIKIEVSLFGMTTGEQLRAAILGEYILLTEWPLLKLLRWFRSLAGSVAIGLSRKYYVDLTGLLRARKRRIVICLDDIERLSPTFQIEELFGIIASLASLNKINTLLICNTKQLTTNESSFDKHKDKLITASFEVLPDPSSVTAAFINRFNNQETKEYLTSIKKEIDLHFGNAKIINFRTLERSVQFLGRAYSELKEELPLSYIDLAIILMDELASGNLRDASFYSALVMHLIMPSKRKMHPGEPDERQLFRSKYLHDTDIFNRYRFSQAVYDFVKMGVFDANAFRTELHPEIAHKSEFSARLAAVQSLEWRYRSDNDAKMTLDLLAASALKEERLTARQVLEVLAWTRCLAEILEIPRSHELESKMKQLLSVRAQEGDESVGHDFSMQFSYFVPLIKDDWSEFTLQQQTGKTHKRETELRGYLEARDITALNRAITNSGENISAFLHGNLLAMLMQFHETEAEFFVSVCTLLIEQCESRSGALEDAATLLLELRTKVDLIKSSTDSKMEKWRLQNLIKTT